MSIKVTIDGKPAEVRPGATILEAANEVGVRIPTLCYDNKLHPYGGCRVCLVEVEGNPRKLPSCTTPVTDGMVILTKTPSIIEARKRILSLILNNHPLDCPVCDKAGACQLQDLVHEYGVGPSLFAEEKRSTEPDYASPVVERNTNRCILCGKCVRICREQNAVGELAFTRRGRRSRISTDFDRPLLCEFCGECIDICPVGALTSRQFKYRARSWNLEAVNSVCSYCGCGCAVTYEGRGGAVVRVTPAKDNYLCVKGRFGWDAMHHADRLMTPKMRIGGRLVDCTWEEALSVVATNLKVIKNKKGADAIGGLGSVRTTNEDSYVFQKFMRTVIGTNNVDMLGRLKLPWGIDSTYFSGELAKIGEHDAVLVLDRDVAEINAYTGIEIVRSVNRMGRKLILAGRGYNKLDAIASVVVSNTRESAIEALISALSGGGRDEAGMAAEVLKSAGSVAVVLPVGMSERESRLVRDLCSSLKSVTYYPVVRRANIQGGLDMGVMPDYYPGYQKVGPDTAARFAGLWDAVLPEQPGRNAVEMISGIKSGVLAALYIMGDDPVGSDPGLADALRGLEFLVVQDIFLTETAKLAHVVLPAASCMEKSGTFTNVERRLQHLAQAEAAIGESKPDWEIIQEVARRMGVGMNYASPRDILLEIRTVVPMYKGLADGACWPPELSPLAGADVNLSLPDALFMKEEVITSGRVLFSSGAMITRSQEIGSISARQRQNSGGKPCRV